jgi:hypothetical protein
MTGLEHEQTFTGESYLAAQALTCWCNTAIPPIFENPGGCLSSFDIDQPNRPGKFLRIGFQSRGRGASGSDSSGAHGSGSARIVSSGRHQLDRCSGPELDEKWMAMIEPDLNDG